jgi:hypothetical protein
MKEGKMAKKCKRKYIYFEAKQQKNNLENLYFLDAKLKALTVS